MKAAPQSAGVVAARLRRGLSMVELLLAMTLAAGIALGIGHVVRLMTTGAANLERRAEVQTEAALAMLRLQADLRTTTGITRQTVGASGVRVTLAHPDVTGDSAADSIVYTWSGTAGDSLTRQVNALASETIVPKCYGFEVMPRAVCRLVADQKYDVRMEHYENTGYAVARLEWASATQSRQIVPQARLYPVASSATTGSGLLGLYFDNMDLTDPKDSRIDSTINFDWGSGQPHSSIAANTFSVRWTGQICPRYSEDYTFYTTSDDGVRLWVDNRLVIDNWTDHTSTENTMTNADVAEVSLQAGSAVNPCRLDSIVRLLNRPRMQVAP